jgi:hypothetical protein
MLAVRLVLRRRKLTAAKMLEQDQMTCAVCGLVEDIGYPLPGRIPPWQEVNKTNP